MRPPFLRRGLLLIIEIGFCRVARWSQDQSCGEAILEIENIWIFHIGSILNLSKCLKDQYCYDFKYCTHTPHRLQ